jgi:ubiquinone/menaquinone biosynthesis C-methylase UbiE
VRRVPRTHTEARAFYNRLSRWYDALANRSEAPHREMGLGLLDAQPGERVLEIGCGTGHGLLRLARDVGGDGMAVGLDVSDGMARVTAERLRGAGFAARVAVCVGDGARLCYARETFDAIFMGFTLELFDTPLLPSVVEGCRALLKLGGRFGVVALSRPRGRVGLPVRIYEWFHDLAPRWIDCRPIPVAEVLTRHGFEIREAQRGVMWGLPVDVVVASVRNVPPSTPAFQWYEVSHSGRASWR